MVLDFAFDIKLTLGTVITSISKSTCWIAVCVIHSNHVYAMRE